MNKGSKIVVTVLLIFWGFIMMGLLQGAGTSKTFTVMLAIGLFLGIRAMWKKQSDSTSEEIKLNKRNNDSTDLTPKE